MNELNLNLIYFVINDMKLTYLKDEIIDIGYIGYTKALNTYDKEKGTFSNYAYECIKNEISKHLSAINRLKRKCNTISLNTKMIDSEDELMDFVADDFNLEQVVIERATFEEIRDIAKEKFSSGKYLIFELLFVDGYTISQLSEMFGLNKKYFWRKQNEMIKALKKIIKEQELEKE